MMVTPVPPVASAPPSNAILDGDEVEKHCDFIFDVLLQNCNVEAQLRTIISNLVNVSDRRISFTPTFANCKMGYLFGDNVRLRLTIKPRTVLEAQESPPERARDALVRFSGVSQELNNQRILRVETVPDDPRPYVFKTYTAWDVLYTLLIVAAGVGFGGFIGLIIFKMRMIQNWEEQEAAEEAAEQAERERAKKGQPSAKAQQRQEQPAAGANGDDDGDLLAFDRTDIDEEGQLAMEKMVDVLERARRLGGVAPSEGLLTVPSRSAPSSRVQFSEAGTRPQQLQQPNHNRFDAQSLPPSVAASSAVRFATQVELPPLRAAPTAVIGPGAPAPSATLHRPQQVGGASLAARLEEMDLPQKRAIVDDSDL